MEWVELAKTGADLGFIVLSAAFVLYIARDLYSKFREHNDSNYKKSEEVEKNVHQRYEILIDDMQKKTDEFYKMLIDNKEQSEKEYKELLSEVLKGINKPHILSEEEDKRMTRVDEEINMYLEKALETCNANRVALIKYHNGGNDMLGNSILKMSISNEKCSAGVIHLINTFQNQLRSAFTYWIKQLDDCGYCFIEDVEDIKNTDTSLYQFMLQSGVKGRYGIAINNTRTGNVIGFLAIDFINKEDANIEQIKHCLNDKKTKIETLLNL